MFIPLLLLMDMLQNKNPAEGQPVRDLIATAATFKQKVISCLLTFFIIQFHGKVRTCYSISFTCILYAYLATPSQGKYHFNLKMWQKTEFSESDNNWAYFCSKSSTFILYSECHHLHIFKSFLFKHQKKMCVCKQKNSYFHSRFCFSRWRTPRWKTPTIQILAKRKSYMSTKTETHR